MSAQVIFSQKPEVDTLGAVTERRYRAVNAPLTLVELITGDNPPVWLLIRRNSRRGEGVQILPTHPTRGAAYRHAQEVYRGIRH